MEGYKLDESDSGRQNHRIIHTAGDCELIFNSAKEDQLYK